jgi:phage gp16-like protein
MSGDPARKALLAKVHIAKAQLGLDDPTWCDLVLRVAGVRSCRDATTPKLAKLADELVRLGFKDRVSHPNSPDSKRYKFRPSAKPQVRLVFALWGELGRMGALTSPTKDALRAFCARMAETGAASTDPEFLTGAQLSLVIEALKGWIGREKQKPTASAAGEGMSNPERVR